MSYVNGDFLFNNGSKFGFVMFLCIVDEIFRQFVVLLLNFFKYK